MPKFTANHDAAVKVAQKTAAQMVAEITDETEKNVRNVIVSVLQDGVPPYDAARTIKSLVGLTSAQGQAALKYRTQLINNGLTLVQVNKQVDKYADRLLSSRADSIARTEVMNALNKGQLESWQQAQSEGLLSDGATKEWIITDDEALCDECEPLDGEQVALDDDFPGGDPPLHPRCRCTIAIGSP